MHHPDCVYRSTFFFFFLSHKSGRLSAAWSDACRCKDKAAEPARVQTERPQRSAITSQRAVDSNGKALITMQIRAGRLRFGAAPKGWGPHKSGEALQRLPETASDAPSVHPRQRANNKRRCCIIAADFCSANRNKTLKINVAAPSLFFFFFLHAFVCTSRDAHVNTETKQQSSGPPPPREGGRLRYLP